MSFLQDLHCILYDSLSPAVCVLEALRLTGYDSTVTYPLLFACFRHHVWPHGLSGCGRGGSR